MHAHFPFRSSDAGIDQVPFEEITVIIMDLGVCTSYGVQLGEGSFMAACKNVMCAVTGGRGCIVDLSLFLIVITHKRQYLRREYIHIAKWLICSMIIYKP